jgi:hypothetical protein
VRTRAHTGRLAPPRKHWHAAVVKPHGQQPRSSFSGSWVFTVPHEDTRRASRAELATGARNSLLTLGERRHASPRSVDKASARANQGEDRHRVFVSLCALRSASSKKNELWALGLLIAHRSTKSVADHDFPWSDLTASSFLVTIPSLCPSHLQFLLAPVHRRIGPCWRRIGGGSPTSSVVGAPERHPARVHGEKMGV